MELHLTSYHSDILDLSMTRITYLTCPNIGISHIILPPTIEIVDCSYNKLQTIHLPAKTLRAYCEHNNLQTITSDSKRLEYLDVSYNELTSLFELPDTLECLYLSGNKICNLSTSFIFSPINAEKFCVGDYYSLVGVADENGALDFKKMNELHFRKYGEYPFPPLEHLFYVL